MLVSGDKLTKEELESLVRREKLLYTLGFDWTEATELALAGVSIKEVRTLILNGCPKHLVSKILL